MDFMDRVVQAKSNNCPLSLFVFNSGGVKRDWVGVPRQLYAPGKEHPRCACVNLDMEVSGGLLKEYENCPSTSTQCIIKSN